MTIEQALLILTILAVCGVPLLLGIIAVISAVLTTADVEIDEDRL
jgi:hypothetical protein